MYEFPSVLFYGFTLNLWDAIALVRKILGGFEDRETLRKYLSEKYWEKLENAAYEHGKIFGVDLYYNRPELYKELINAFQIINATLPSITLKNRRGVWNVIRQKNYLIP